MKPRAGASLPILMANFSWQLASRWRSKAHRRSPASLCRPGGPRRPRRADSRLFHVYGLSLDCFPSSLAWAKICGENLSLVNHFYQSRPLAKSRSCRRANPKANSAGPWDPEIGPPVNQILRKLNKRNKLIVVDLSDGPLISRLTTMPEVHHER